MWIRMLGVGLLLALGGCRTPSSTPPAPTVAEFLASDRVTREEREFQVPEGTQRIRIVNLRGDVRVRMSDRAILGVYATVQRLDERAGELRLQPELKDGVYLLDLGFVGDQGWPSDHAAHGRIDAGIWIPRKLPIEVQTTFGLIQVKRAKGSVWARSTSGAISASSAQQIDLKSESGRIIGRQESGLWPGTSQIISERGNILAAVPFFADMALEARSRGAFTVDPGLPAPSAVSGGFELVRQFGAGHQRLIIQSGGDLHLVPVVK